MTIREALRLIGLGKTVTVELFGAWLCQRRRDRPRLLPGDNCKIVRKGNEIKGVIRSIKGSQGCTSGHGKESSIPLKLTRWNMLMMWISSWMESRFLMIR